MTALTLGFIPLTDCAPLVVAREMGFFADEGLSVTLSREASWATIRDKVAFGALDGAHMLAPIPLAATLAAARESAAMIAPMALNRNGAGITVSTGLAGAIAASSLAQVVAARRQDGRPPLTFAVVFPYAVHNYALRGWLAAAGVDPNLDVSIVVVPPPRMVEQLADGRIDGFCVGAPWNTMAWATGAGEMLTTTATLLPGAPDKVLGVPWSWAERDRPLLEAVLRALTRAGIWCDAAANRQDLATLLARPDLVDAPASAIARALDGEIIFQRDGAATPSQADALWILSQMQHWGQIGPQVDHAALASRVFRGDLLERALTARV
ncbi:MAG: CmpA/NrtA family ABC transporter substrate-binding protein [Caulobacter sp.]|nr:CmpA/NrtA family ABC transporter substrate-binding protein [Caulobacter sp.]